MVPMSEIFNTDFHGIRSALPCNRYKAQREIIVIRSLHQTSMVELRVIVLPKTPVKPHKKTAVCNCSNAFFIGSKKRYVVEMRRVIL